MLTFTSSGNSTLRCTGAAKSFVVFPEAPSKSDLNLYDSPQEFPDHDNLSWPGEYDIGGITVRGIGHLEGQKISYLVEADGYRIAYPAQPLEDWTDHEIELLGDVHVLVLPAEDPKRCQMLIDEIEPRALFIVPTKDGSMNADVLKACGAIDKERVKEYKLKGALPAEGREVVVFG